MERPANSRCNLGVSTDLLIPHSLSLLVSFAFLMFLIWANIKIFFIVIFKSKLLSFLLNINQTSQREYINTAVSDTAPQIACFGHSVLEGYPRQGSY